MWGCLPLKNEKRNSESGSTIERGLIPLMLILAILYLKPATQPRAAPRPSPKEKISEDVNTAPSPTRPAPPNLRPTVTPASTTSTAALAAPALATTASSPAPTARPSPPKAREGSVKAPPTLRPKPPKPAKPVRPEHRRTVDVSQLSASQEGESVYSLYSICC